jgi:hypothetical protein
MIKSKRCLPQICLNCEFLLVCISSTTAFGPVTEERHLSVTEVSRLRQGDGRKAVLGNGRLMCARHVWAVTPVDSQTDDTMQLILEQPRDDSCFFYPRSRGIQRAAAEELERRAADRREAEKDRQLTRWAFYVALGALIVSILTNLGSCAWSRSQQKGRANTKMPASSAPPPSLGSRQ